MTTKQDKKYDLEERTVKFGNNIIMFAKQVKPDHITRPIINQIIRSGTSVGAIYHEANECNSKKDFNYKINLAKKEAKETIYWLKMIVSANKEFSQKAVGLKKEAHELILIFAAINRNQKGSRGF